MRGTLIYVMGPSGSGKDSLLSALRPRLRGLPVAFARRYISRPACAGGEQHMALSAGSILSMEAQGRLAMRWSSHGCQYGIGRSIDGSLEHGICVIVNGSRDTCRKPCGAILTFFPCWWRRIRPYCGNACWPGEESRARIWRNVCSVRRRRCLPLLLSGSYASTTPGSWRRRSISWKTSCGLSCHERIKKLPASPVDCDDTLLKIKAIL